MSTNDTLLLHLARWAFCPRPDIGMELLSKLFEPKLSLIFSLQLILHDLLAQLAGLLGQPVIIDRTLVVLYPTDRNCSLPMTAWTGHRLLKLHGSPVILGQQWLLNDRVVGRLPLLFCLAPRHRIVHRADQV